jgi:hypothetical protein
MPPKAAKYLVPFPHHLLSHPMNVGKRSAQRGNHLFKTFAPLLLAKEFGATAGLREAMQNAGVVDKPDIYFLS